MSQTNTDYLFQMIAPPADRSTSATRTNDDAAGFSNHLSNASTSVFDLLHQPSGNETPNRPRRRDDANDSARNRESSQSTAPSTTGSSAKSSSSTSATNADSSSDAAPVKHTCADDQSDKERDDETGGEVAAGVAGASSDASKQTAIKDGDGHNDGHEANAQVKEKLKVAAAKAAQKDAGSGETAVDAKTRVDEVAAIADIVNGDVVAEEVTEPATESADGKYAENSRGGKQAGKTDVEATQTVDPGANEHNSENKPSSDSTGKRHGDAVAASNIKTAVLKSKAGDDESTDDDARGDEKSTDRGNARTDAGAAAKVVATPIVSAATAELAASTGDGAAKEDGDSAVKSVGTKHETAAGSLARALRTASDITRGARSEGTSDLPQVDPARFVSRVAKAFQTASERDGSVQLRLNPPDLGALKLQLTVKDGVMSAAVETDNANARRLLLDHLPALRDRLAEQNIRVDRFDVDVRQEGNNGGAQADPRGFQQNPYHQQPEQTDARRGNASQRRVAEVAAPVPPAISPGIAGDGINLVI
jgi:flagellar hook-length control protein FliK